MARLPSPQLERWRINCQDWMTSTCQLQAIMPLLAPDEHDQETLKFLLRKEEQHHSNHGLFSGKWVNSCQILEQSP